MMMRKRTWVLLIAVLCGFGTACGGDDGNDNGGGLGGTGASGMGAAGTGVAGMMGTAGMNGGGGMGAAGMGEPSMCVNQGDINTDCPQVPPITGDCAPRGECCHRASNAAKEAALGPDDPLVLEYRINYSVTTNHPLTIGTDLIANSTTTRYEQEQQSTLWQFEFPRAGGQEVAGMGKITIGQGTYNCDGTYSFYSDTAAPERAGLTDAGRWGRREAMVMVDPSKEGAERIRPMFSQNSNRELTFTPFLEASSFALDWELVNQGFEIKTIDTSAAGRDCQGARSNGQWDAKGGQFIIYTPVADNASQTITLISQNYCQLVAFGILPEGSRQTSCTEHPRCVPDGGMFGDGGCDWVKLPDSLCPTTDDERALWGCHLGDETNVNQETDYPTELNCTQEAPTEIADPNAGGSAGQCCDPLGMSATLPACNAWRLIQDYVAAAVEITDQDTNEIQQNCLQ